MARKLRNARQILDLAIPDKIWPCSQKPKKNKGRHPIVRRVVYRGVTGNFFGIGIQSRCFGHVCDVFDAVSAVAFSD